MTAFGRVDEAMNAAVTRGVFPGAVLLVRNRGEVVYSSAFGLRALEPESAPMQVDTIFDLSSLTKPLATSVAMMLLVRTGRIRLDDRVTRFFPNFGVHGKTHVTFRHLLSHCSGLPAWRPYYKEILEIERSGQRIDFVGSRAAKEFVYEQIQRERPENPAGQKTTYSDLGFMLLGAAVEQFGGVSLDRFCYDRIFGPIGLRSTAFVDIALLRTRKIEPVTAMIAPTEACPWRKRVLCGEVHDDNAYAMGGAAGHAGLFSSASDVDTILCRLKQCYDGKDDFVPQAVVREFWTRDSSVPGSTWALGWDGPAEGGSAAGGMFSRQTVGHLGFTGTSIWLDLKKDRHVILLSNRVHPTRDNDKIREFRPALHDAVNRALGTQR